NADQAVEPFELAKDERAMRPGAGERDVKVIAPGFGLVPARAARAGRAIGRDPVPERRLLAHEAPAGAFGVVPLILPDTVDKQSHRFSPPAAVPAQAYCKTIARRLSPDRGK